MITNRKRYERERNQKTCIRKSQIEALIEKHRPCTPKTPDKVKHQVQAKMQI